LYRKDVREDLRLADVVIPSLDAGDEKVFLAVNRPHPGVSFNQQIQGFIALQQENHTRMWLDVTLVKGLNDSEESLQNIKNVIDRIKPDAVNLHVPAHPSRTCRACPPKASKLALARQIIQNAVFSEDTKRIHGLSHARNNEGETYLSLTEEEVQ
jgi:wyosine [tRNA(Phe)-imidazoG37] synthetase (radical SAM superfamily)